MRMSGQTRKELHMHHDDHLDRALKSLGNVAAPSLSGDFMDGVWLRAGQMEQAAGQRRRLALMVGMAFIGLGTGIGVVQAPASAEPASYQLIDGADLSPSALLHVEP